MNANTSAPGVGNAEGLLRFENLELGDVGGLGAFLPLAGIETDPLALVQGLEAGALDSGVVDE
jgi:hypothetical protein